VDERKPGTRRAEHLGYWLLLCDHDNQCDSVVLTDRVRGARPAAGAGVLPLRHIPADSSSLVWRRRRRRTELVRPFRPARWTNLLRPHHCARRAKLPHLVWWRTRSWQRRLIRRSTRMRLHGWIPVVDDDSLWPERAFRRALMYWLHRPLNHGRRLGATAGASHLGPALVIRPLFRASRCLDGRTRSLDVSSHHCGPANHRNTGLGVYGATCFKVDLTVRLDLLLANHQ
jgi:hypothetical protein